MAKELFWNVDGHRLLLNVVKQTVEVSAGICPHGSVEGASCYHAGINSCCVNYFINMFGLETNHGAVQAEPSIEIAWAKDGSEWEIDLVEFRIIPVNDPNFQDWYTAVSSVPID